MPYKNNIKFTRNDSHDDVPSNKKKNKKKVSYLAAAIAVSNPPTKSSKHNQTITKWSHIGQITE